MSADLRRVLFVSGSGSGNTLRYRVRLAEEALRSRGVSTAAVHFTDPMAQRWAAEADVVALYRTPATRRVLELVAHARGTLGLPVTFDVDDLVFLPEHLRSVPFLGDLRPRARRLFEADVARRGRVLPFVDRASGTTAVVADDLATLTGAPVDVLPNGVSRVGQELAARTSRRSPDGRLRLGYFSGSATHDDDWAIVEPAVASLMANDPRIDLWLVGPLRTGPMLDRFTGRITRLEPVRWQELPALLAAVDINVAPLDATPFTSGKSAIKWLEAALVGTPTIATATPPFRAAVLDGTTGLLVEPQGDWAEPLARLVEDAALRDTIGLEARAAALADFGPDVQAERYHAFFTAARTDPRADVDPAEIIAASRAEGRSRGMGLELERYPFGPDLLDLEIPPPPGVARWSRTRHVVRAPLRQGKRYGKAILYRLPGR